MKNKQTVFEKVSDQLKLLLHRSVSAAFMDGLLLNDHDAVLFGDVIEIYLSGGLKVEITTDDIPHFYGEGDLELKIGEYRNEKLLSKPHAKEISLIRVYGWKSTGCNLFKPARYLVQVEFYHGNEVLLASGFFYSDQDTMKMECLITGELSVSSGYHLSVDDYQNLFVKEIK